MTPLFLSWPLTDLTPKKIRSKAALVLGTDQLAVSDVLQYAPDRVSILSFVGDTDPL